MVDDDGVCDDGDGKDSGGNGDDCDIGGDGLFFGCDDGIDDTDGSYYRTVIFGMAMMVVVM